MVDAHLRSKTIETADIKNLIIGGQTGIDGIRFCLAAVTNGENLADPAFSWFLQYKNKNGQGESVGLTPVYENGLVKLPWIPNKLATQVPGRMQIQLYAAIVTGEGEAAVVDKQWVSEFAVIYIQENINPDPIVATEPSIIEYYVTLYAAYKNAAEAAAAAALESEQAAALSEGNAADSEAAALASKQAAGLSEQAAALAAGSALQSKNSIDATFTDPGLVAVRTDMATSETSKIQKVAANEANITEVADDLNLGSASKIKKVADDIAKVGAVADGMTHVTAVEAKLTDIAKVAAIEVAVPKVAAIDTDVTKVAAIDEAVGLVAGVKDDVTAVALIDDEISAIALIKDQIVSLEAEKLKVSAVEAKLAEIQGVYAKLQAIEGLYGKSTEIDALYAQLATITSKANQADVEALQLATARQETRANGFEKTLNSTQGTTFDTTDIGIVALPPNAAGRALANVKGLTARNLFKNGNFSAGTANWTASGSTLSVVNGLLLSTGTGTTANAGFSQHFATLKRDGSVNFIKLRVRVTNSACTSIRVFYAGYNLATTINNPVENQWYEILARITISSDGAPFFNDFHHRYADAAIATGKIMEVDGDYGVSAYNLTSNFGSGNEPSEADCQKYFPTYFADTKSVSGPCRLLGRGKNLLDINKPFALRRNGDGIAPSGSVSINIDGSTVNVLATNTFDGVAWTIPCKAGDILTFSLGTAGGHNRYAIYWRDKNDVAISKLEGGILSYISLTAPTNAKKVVFCIANGNSAGSWSFGQPQVEHGTAKTAYEPYKSSSLYISDADDYQSVTASKDEILVQDGEYWRKQNVQRHVLQESDFDSLVTWPTSVDYVTILNSKLIGAKEFISNTTGQVYLPNWLEIKSDDYNLATSIGKCYTFNTSGNHYVGLIIANGTYADLSAARAALAGTVIYYQLATPIYTKLNTLGNLLSLRSVTFEPYYQHSHQTNASGQITLPYAGTIEAVYGYDESFTEYELAPTQYSLSGNVLTITGALENEVYYVMMFRDYAAPIPQMTVNSINSKTTIRDTTNGKYYELVPTITNGILIGQNPIEVV